MAGAAVGRRRDRVWRPASSRLHVPHSVMHNPQQVSESVDQSLDTDDVEYEGNAGQSEDSEETQ